MKTIFSRFGNNRGDGVGIYVPTNLSHTVNISDMGQTDIINVKLNLGNQNYN